MVTRYGITHSVNLLLELSFKEQYSSIRINLDGTSPHTTHIALHSKVLEELVNSGTIIVTHKSTEHMLTDIFTKYREIVAFRNIMTQTKAVFNKARTGMRRICSHPLMSQTKKIKYIPRCCARSRTSRHRRLRRSILYVYKSKNKMVS